MTLIKDHLAFYPDRVDAIEERKEDSNLFTCMRHSRRFAATS